MNDALVAPAGTVTEAGVVKLALLSERVTTAPPVGAAPLKVTVQVVVPGVLIVAGAQSRLVGVTVPDCVTEIVPELPVRVIEEPVEEAPSTLVSPMVVLPADGESVILTTATVPFPMLLAFMPLAIQIYDPGVVLLQVNVSPAAVTAAPATWEIVATLAVG